MKDNFSAAIRQKTDRELEIISNDVVFYSERERLLALNELEKRGSLSAELVKQRELFDDPAGWEPMPFPDPDRKIPTQKIYKKTSITSGTFLGGPLVAGYLIAQNFKAFGEPGKARKSWIYAILATVVIVGGIFFIPAHIDIPNFLIPLVYTLITLLLVERFQGRGISAHIAAGGPAFSWGRTILIGLIGAAVTAITAFILVLFFWNVIEVA